jgi:transcriptional regulator with XRE-family HTH domain
MQFCKFSAMKERIRLLIEKEKLTAKQFAALTDMQVSNVSHLLSGRSNPSLDSTQKILTAFPNLNPEWLLFGKQPMYKHEKLVQYDLFGQPIENEPNLPISESLPPVSAPILEQKHAVNQPIVHDVVVKEVVKEIPAKKIQRIVVYFTDNTFEEFSK